MAPVMEGGGSKMPEEVRRLTIRQARVAVMSGKNALAMATGAIADEIRDFVTENSDNWIPVSELKKMTREQAEERNRRMNNGTQSG